MKTLCTVHLLVFLNSQAAPAAMEDRTIGETQEPYDATADSGTLIPRRLKNEYMAISTAWEEHPSLSPPR